MPQKYRANGRECVALVCIIHALTIIKVRLSILEVSLDIMAVRIMKSSWRRTGIHRTLVMYDAYLNLDIKQFTEA